MTTAWWCRWLVLLTATLPCAGCRSIKPADDGAPRQYEGKMATYATGGI
jgi:hypothetical protein